MTQRVGLFIDYQNAYKRAREVFGIGTEWHVFGQIRPVALGLTLVNRSPDRKLVSVHVFRGMPQQRYDEKGFSAAQRQIAGWKNTGGDILHVHTRPLNYRDRAVPREKGIDVALAVAVVMGFQQDDFDVAIVFSDDTDLHPALEAIGQLGGPGHAELATWYKSQGPRQVMSGGRNVYTHVLGDRDFRRVEDTQDYNRRTARKPRPRKA